MRIFLDARTIRPGMTGVGRSTLELTRALASQKEIERLRALILRKNLAIAREAFAGTKIEPVAAAVDYQSHPFGDLALRFWIPQFVERGEIYHGPAFMIPGGMQRFPRVVTIHDLGVFKRPDDHPRRFGAYLRWSIKRSVKWADRIIVPTLAVAADLAREFEEAGKKIRAVPEAAAGKHEESEIANDELRMGDLSKNPYLVSIGTIEPRKDPLTALRALEMLKEFPDLHWIWIGAEGYKGNEIIGRIRQSPAAARFHLAGYAGVGKIQPLLAKAAALVYPSLDEGFGLPPLEAMQARVPAIVSDIPAIREVCGEAAAYFPAGNAEALADAIRRVMSDSGIRAELTRKGAERSLQFSWDRTARETLAVYRELSA